MLKAKSSLVNLAIASQGILPDMGNRAFIFERSISYLHQSR